MLKTGKNQNDGKQDWQKTDARVLGQILAAQNILFVLPDTKRIAEFFAQALVSVPGVTSCRVCLGDVSVQAGLDSDVCRECEALRKEAGETLAMPFGFRCRLAEEHDIRIVIITLETSRHTFGFFVFRTDTTGVFESYSPFINNLSNYIALSLENRLQKNLLQKGEEKFRDIYDKSPIGIEVYDSSGALLDINKACLAIFGIADNEDMKGFKLFEDPNITDAVKKKLLEGETVRYEAPFDFEKVKEYRLYRTMKSGIIHLDVLITPLGLKEEVGPVGYLVQVQDVTARKLAEDELKKYQEHLEDIIKERTAELTAANKQLYQEINERKQAEENLVQQSRTLDSFFKYTITPLVVLDRHFNFIRVNEAYAAAGQRDVSEFPGHNHFEFYPSDAKKIFEDVVETKSSYQTTARPFIYPDHPEWGVTYWDWTLTPILSDTGEVEFLVFALKDVTERKKAEESLRESEEKFRALFENAKDGIMQLSADGKVVALNASFASMHGYSVDEMLKMNLKDLDTPESAQLATERFQRMFAGELMSFEVEHYCKNGQTIPLEVSANMIIIGGEKYILGFHRDITERKQAENALRDSEERLRVALTSVDMALFRQDKDLRYTWMYSPQLGYTTAEVAGKTDADLLPSPDVNRITDIKRHVLENGVSAREEVTIKWNDQTLYFDLVVEPLRGADGMIVGITGSSLNITEQKKTEELIRNVLESVDEGFIIIDRDYRIITANRAYADEVRMPVEDIIGKHCYEISHHYPKPCYEAGEDCAVKHVFETGEPYTVTHTHYDSKGDPVYIETKAYPLSKDESGKIMTAIEILVDITEKTKLEAQLRQSQKMEAVGQIAGGIAHDFNNILTAIIGYASITQMKLKEDDPLRHNLDQVLASAERAANLTQGLLAFSRKQISNPVPVNLNELIKKIEKFLRRVIGEDIELKSILSERELTVMADHGQIDQVLMNLATNARDAMPGGGSLTIETGTMEIDEGYIKAHGYGKAGTYALISVTDSGIGMDEKTREKIFEPFFTTKEVGKGTGLGLSIVYGIVKQHNGYVNCYSEPGKGTTFRIYLPLIKTEKRAEIKPSEPVAPMTGTETILLAEDEENVRALTKLVLEEYGYKVIEAIDGEDAVNKFMENKDRIDLLLLDVIMPKMSGKEAYDRIRKIMPDIKVLFASGYPADFIRKDDITEQGLSCVVKPTSPTALIKKVREVLDKKYVNSE